MLRQYIFFCIFADNKFSDILNVNEMYLAFVRSESSRRATRPRAKVAPSCE